MTQTPLDPRALAERAAQAAEEGRIPEARVGIAQALAMAGGEEAATDLRVLFLAFQFHFRQGELEAAERLCRRRLRVAEELERTSGKRDVHTGRACCNLGLVLQYAGKLDAAEASLRRAIDLNRAINHEEGVARDLGTLALVFEARNDLDTAERLYLEALAIAERIGCEPVIATDCANLGDIALARGDRPKARALLTRSVEILTRLKSWKVKGVAEKLAELDPPSTSR